MSKTQEQDIIDIGNIIYKLTALETAALRELAEKMIDVKLLTLAPDAILENMDITEKLMLIDWYSMSEEERQKETDEAIPLEDILKEEGLK